MLDMLDKSKETAADFLKSQAAFIGPDPEIMNDHGLAPRTRREEELLARPWDRRAAGLMRDRLVSNCSEAWEVMSQIASSPGAKWGDAIAGIWTASGDLAVVSTGGVLGFAAITHYVLRHIMKHWKDDPTIGVRSGDAFMHNDARWGAIHPADFTTFMPVFHGGELVAWVGVSEHLGENGAIEPGGLSSMAESVYGEGLRMPPVKVAENGELKRDLVTLFQNMVRDRSLMYEDMKARMTVCKMLLRRVAETIADLGADSFVAMLRIGLEDVEAEVKRRIARIPDGTTRALAFADHTLREPAYVKVSVEMRKAGGDLTVSFRGSSPEFANRTVNSVLGSTKAAIGNLLCGFVWPDLPRNQAVLAPVKFEVDPCSCLASGFETPNTVSMMTLFPAFTAAQVAMAKLLYAVPEIRTACIAPWFAMTNSYVYGGINQFGRTVASVSANVNAMPGGAAANRDGEHSISAIFAIMSDLPETEVQEEAVPYISLVSKKLLTDNQGFGRQRGGTGYFWTISPKDSPLWGFATLGVGSYFPVISGLFGGYGCGTYPLARVSGVDVFERIDENPRAFSTYDFAGIMNDRPFADANYTTGPFSSPFQFVPRGELYLMSQGAGGGFGDVIERDPEAVADDVRDGVISLATAGDVYRVALDPDRLIVDPAATRELRQATRDERLRLSLPFDQFVESWVTDGPRNLPAPYFGCWNGVDEIWVGNEEVPAPADALQPVTMEDPRHVRIRALEAELEALRNRGEGA
jgi:acetone carboxylase alpha subunit